MHECTFLDFQVRAAVVGNYKSERLFGRGDDYAYTIIASAAESLRETGKFAIGRHESKSGDPVYFKLDGQALVLVEDHWTETEK